MREYSKVSPQFWIGETGKKIRRAGAEAQVVALYLMTSPHSNSIGLYYLPIVYIAHETGLGARECEDAIATLQQLGFCRYDVDRELVWVCEMAAWQIGESLKEGDKQIVGVANLLDGIIDSPLKKAFAERYGQAYRLGEIRHTSWASEDPSEPSEDPSEVSQKGVRSTETETETETERRGFDGGSLEQPPSAVPRPPGLAPPESDQENITNGAQLGNYLRAHGLSKIPLGAEKQLAEFVPLQRRHLDAALEDLDARDKPRNRIGLAYLRPILEDLKAGRHKCQRAPPRPTGPPRPQSRDITDEPDNEGAPGWLAAREAERAAREATQ